MRTTTSIITSDGKALSGFEKIQEIAEKAQNTEVIKKVAEKRDDNRGAYDGQSVRTNKCAKLTVRIPNLLKQMNLRNWNGEIYSTSGVFRENFAKDLNFLLAWLGSIPQQTTNDPVQVGVTALQMKSVLKWLMLATKYIGSDGDSARIDNMILKL
jgi:hypothetical protein